MAKLALNWFCMNWTNLELNELNENRLPETNPENRENSNRGSGVFHLKVQLIKCVCRVPGLLVTVVTAGRLMLFCCDFSSVALLSSLMLSCRQIRIKETRAFIWSSQLKMEKMVSSSETVPGSVLTPKASLLFLPFMHINVFNSNLSH